MGEKVCLSGCLQVRVKILLQQRAGSGDGEFVNDEEYPMSILIAVVLPAPFGPIIPKHSPRLTPIVNPRTELVCVCVCVCVDWHIQQQPDRQTGRERERERERRRERPACFAGGPGYVLRRSSTCTASLSTFERESPSRARTRISSSSTSGACSRVQRCACTYAKA